MRIAEFEVFQATKCLVAGQISATKSKFSHIFKIGPSRAFIFHVFMIHAKVALEESNSILWD
jgi:hypothetical protein